MALGSMALGSMALGSMADGSPGSYTTKRIRTCFQHLRWSACCAAQACLTHASRSHSADLAASGGQRGAHAGRLGCTKAGQELERVGYEGSMAQ